MVVYVVETNIFIIQIKYIYYNSGHNKNIFDGIVQANMLIFRNNTKIY